MVTTLGNATSGYAYNSADHRPIPHVDDTPRRPTHRPWCVDCKRKDRELDSSQRCEQCVRAAASREKAAAEREARAAEIAALERRHREEVVAQQRRKAEPVRRTTELPKEGKQGQPTTRSSAPRANQASSTSGRAPDAGPSTTEEMSPPAVQETRPAAAGGPTYQQILDAQVEHAAAVLRRTHGHPHPAVAVARTSAIAALEALHLITELHTKPARASVTKSAPRPTPSTERARRRDRIELPGEEVARLYRDGWTLLQLAERYGCSHPVIARTLDEQGVARRGAPVPRSPDLVERVRTLYVEEELTQTQVADRLGVSTKVVQNIMIEAGIEPRPSAADLSKQGIGRPIKIDPDQHQDILDRYQSGESAPAIAAAYGVTAPSIYSILRRHGVTDRHGNRTLAGAGRDQAAGLRARIAELGVTSRAIKQWGLDNGLLGTMHRGQPSRDLVEKYAAAHPTPSGDAA